MAVITPGIRRCNSVSNYIGIFGKPRILLASFLLAPLSNNYVNDYFLFFKGMVFLTKKGKGLVVY